LLEEKLINFEGTLLLVSHDRAFLDNVVTSVFVLDGSSKVQEFIGGYTDWIAYNESKAQQQAAAPAAKKSPLVQSTVSNAGTKKKKLSYKEQQELKQIPELIGELETQQAALTQEISDPNFYKKASDKVNTTLDNLKKLESQLAKTYQRWDELEAADET